MKSRDENNLVPIPKLILQLPFKLPIGIINQDQNTWPPKINQPLARIRASKKRTRRPLPQTSLPAHLTSCP